MKPLILPAILAVFLMAAFAGSADDDGVRGQVAIDGEDSFTWTPQNFAGFYYDANKNLGTEVLSATVTEGRKLSGDEPFGLVYRTTAQMDSFDFEDWGSYYAMGFLGKKCLAGYAQNSDFYDGDLLLYKNSEDPNSLSKGQLEEILLDQDDEMTVTCCTPIKLAEGYELIVRSIQPRQGMANLDLLKDGAVVDTKVVSPSKDSATYADKTYLYMRDVGSQKKLATIAVHFKNVYNDSLNAVATVDGIWQISDQPMDVQTNAAYDKMRVAGVNPMAMDVSMDNSKNPVFLEKGSDLPIMPGFRMKVGDNDSLRYCPYREHEAGEPGTGEVRSPVATGSFDWNSQNFAGFYYDLDGGLGSEDLRAEVTDGNILSEYNGLTYTTSAQASDFSFEEFGKYYVIGFLGEKYFAGYIDAMDEWVSYPLLYKESKDDNSMARGQLEKIVMDESSEQVIEMGSQLKLGDGYALLVKGISEEGRCYLQLLKNGDLVESKIIAPSAEYAILADKTFFYKKDVGSQRGLVTIAVHFKNVYRDGARGTATVDGIWQISEEPVSIAVGAKYGRMRIASIDSNNMMLTMDNLGNQIALERGTDIRLMGNIGLRAAESIISDESSSLIYYIYKTEVDASPSRNSQAPSGERGAELRRQIVGGNVNAPAGEPAGV